MTDAIHQITPNQDYKIMMMITSFIQRCLCPVGPSFTELLHTSRCTGGLQTCITMQSTHTSGVSASYVWPHIVSMSAGVCSLIYLRDAKKLNHNRYAYPLEYAWPGGIHNKITGVCVKLPRPPSFLICSESHGTDMGAHSITSPVLQSTLPLLVHIKQGAPAWILV